MFATISELSTKYYVSLLCNIANVSKSGYYYWLNRSRFDESNILSAVKFEQFKNKGILGYRRMKTVLFKQHNISIGANKLRILMAKHNLQSAIRRKKYKHSSASRFEKFKADNILNREFTSHKPNEKFVTDITYIPTKNFMLYLCVIIDLFNGEVIAHKLSNDASSTLSIDTVKMLIDKRDVRGAILHSDQGIHYINKAYQSLLKEQGIIASMSRKGNCWDNALAENFFSHFKCECIRINKHLINSYENVEKLVESYLYFYNNDRFQARLKNMSPISYRKQHF